MTLRGSLLSFRMQRFETTIVVGAALISVIVSALVVWAFNAGGYARCYTSDGDVSVFGSLCLTGLFPWLDRAARVSVSLAPIFPVIAGLLAGAPIVARELESGTARLAWSLAPSRTRWLAQRAVPILIMVLLAALAIGFVAEGLTHTLAPTQDLDQSFAGFRARGLLIGIEALLVASIALAIGAILGRAAPTLIVTLVLTTLVGVAVDKVERQLMTNEAVVAESNNYMYTDANLYLDSRLKFPDGSILTYDEAYRTHPELQNGYDEMTGPVEVIYYIPGSRYHEVERREALALLAVAAAFGMLATFAVVRRRPR
jgi:hypothetical protein